MLPSARLKSIFPVIFLLLFSWQNCAAADKFDAGVASKLTQASTEDFGAILERGFLRVLVPYSRTFYFLDQATQKGITYESLVLFEKHINKKLGNKSKIPKVRVLVIPTVRDKLIPMLKEGRGDIAAGNLTITEERLKQIGFSDPFWNKVDEILVTGPKSPEIKSINELSGQTVHVRQSSSYRESLERLNQDFKKQGLAPIKIVKASEYLEDEDLMEMVGAGVLPAIIVDSHKAQLWAKILDQITIHPEIAVNTGGSIAWAVRKENPELTKMVNSFVKTHKKGTLTGNMLAKKYFNNGSFITNNTNKKSMERFDQTVELFQRYGKQYSFDWLMLTALAYQESLIDQSKRSPAGAIGVMQILPSTAKDKNVGIPEIDKIEPNIHAGTKYIRFMVDRYFNDPKIDDLNRGLFAFASYNAGPARVAKLRKEAAESGFDPNVWFNNVEVIAAKRIGQETVNYVRNIFKYYTAYRLINEKNEMREVLKQVHSE